MIPIFFGKTFLQRAMLALIAASLGACGGEGDDGAVASPVGEQAPPPATGNDNPPPAEVPNQPPEIDGIPAATATVGEPYEFKPSFDDADEGDFLEFSITNKPEWATFDTENGILSGTPAATSVGVSEDITITVTDGRDTRSIGPFKIEVSSVRVPANAPPTITGTPAASVIVGQAYSFTPVASDPDAADVSRLRYSISNRPSWMTFSTTTGRLQGTPGAVNVATYSGIRISVSDGPNTVALPTFSIQVRALDNHAPVISGTPGTSVQATTAYTFTPVASDPDGDRLTFTINNRPRWATLNAQTGVLSGTPASTDVGTYSNLIISANDGRTATALRAFSIVVTAAPNRAPVISGNPPTSVAAGTAYSFTPTASDPDNNNFSFSIQNAPAWAQFNTATGRLSGTPGVAGTHSNIRISVTDGSLTTSLPAFQITVTGTANRAPTISGNPVTTTSTGAAYSFTPSGNDPDGNTLTYSVTNLPSWATFNASTGRVSGTPTAANAGTYSNIGISVSDGSLSASLTPFTLTVVQSSNGSATLSWTPPTQNTDGTSLSNLAGYRIVYGRTASSLDQTVQVANAGTSAYTITGLASGTWYFRVKAYNSAGGESTLSNSGSKTIP